MEIKSIEIKNYRAIASLTVPLNYSINPIIGINESGKTSILKAILCLDKDRDKFNKGEHLEYQNKYSTSDTRDCQITANITLTQRDISNLKVYSKVKTESEIYSEITGLNTNTIIRFTRTLSSERKFEITNTEISLALQVKLTKFIQINFPVFLYFDDFTDRVPEEIAFSESYAYDKRLSRGHIREWQEIIQEILKRSELEGIESSDNALSNYLRVDDSDRRQDILSDIEDVLNSEIMEEWKKVKQRGKNNFADDSDNLQLQLQHDTEGNKFSFKVRDTSNKNKRRTFNVNERSKGFQWFFNYMIKLKFNPRYTQIQENSIFLLDEPGSYLHSSAQSELLKELKVVSKSNTIIYCTHSQFLLNPEDIKLGSIKIASKRNSKIELNLFGEFKGKRDSGALSPVYQALQINGVSDFFGEVIITEGITDFYVLRMLQESWNYPKKGTKIIPGSSAGSASTLISFALGFANDFRVVFDNDPAGIKAQKKYQLEFGEHIERYFHSYHSDSKKFLLEDHFIKRDQQKLCDLTSTKSFKKALAILYIDFPDKTKEYIENLDEESKSLLGKTVNQIGI